MYQVNVGIKILLFNLLLLAPPCGRIVGHCMLANKQGSAHQRRSVDALHARFVAPALRLNPSEAIWRPSTTSSSRLYSSGILLTHAHQRSTMLPSHPPLACTFARWHNVAGSRAPGLIYAVISSCNIPRILFAFRLRAPHPYRNASNVDCRRRWRISMESPSHRAVSVGMGEETATCGCRAFPGGPRAFVYGVRGRTGPCGRI